MKRSVLRGVSLSAASLLVVGLSACGAANEGGSTSGGGAGTAGGGGSLSGQLSGAGASSQAAAVEAWKAAFEDANSGATVNYDPAGSGAGRTQFLSGGVQFAGSDAHLKPEEMAKVATACKGGELVQFPVYISPIAVAYKVEGVTNLQLSPATLAGLMAGTIKTWNDPKVAADNPGVNLPATAVVPVHRSDDSGTTDNFTDYLHKTAPTVWKHEADGTWPISGGEAAKGTAGVVQAMNAGTGTIGYADASQIGQLSHAKIKVGDAYVAYTPEAAAKIVDESPRAKNQPQYSYAIDIDRTTKQAGTYPLVLASYELACTKYADANQAKLVKAWLTYIASEEGQQAAAKAAGSAPISAATRENAMKGINAIS